MRAGTVLNVRGATDDTCATPGHCEGGVGTVEIFHDDDDVVTLYTNLANIVAVEGARIPRSTVLGQVGALPIHVQLQQDCGIWRCPALPMNFSEGAIETGTRVVSANNCN